jgi:exopolyphosphatase / guanosine-5'-triphosphate,3'-diphosphate pyrophosphatase
MTPIAIIDIGSNSARVMVFERDASNHLRLLAGSRAPLRLVRDVDERAELTEKTMARAMEALRDFKAIATGSGVARITAVATAAMRDAGNGAQFAARVQRELGIRIRIIDGRREALYGCDGAVRGLDVGGGLVFDVGGGSMQAVRFERRRVRASTSLPFGALRLSGRFLTSDPPTRKQLRQLRDHVRRGLEKARVRELRAGDRLVGTGGTIRNLARIDQHARGYPIDRTHGYELSTEALSEIVDRLARTAEKRRDEIAGLSAERADSIVGGAVAIHTLTEFVGASGILVSGQGLREGLALRLFDMPMRSPAMVKEAALSSLVSRFGAWRADVAARRRAVAATLLQALEPATPARLACAVDVAARVLDVGRSLDVVNRYDHAAAMLLIADVGGISHEELAFASAIARRAGDRHADVPRFAAVREASARGLLDRLAIILALADEIEARCPPGRRINLSCTLGRHVTLRVPALESWLVKDLDKRFERAFGRPLIVSSARQRG